MGWQKSKAYLILMTVLWALASCGAQRTASPSPTIVADTVSTKVASFKSQRRDSYQECNANRNPLSYPHSGPSRPTRGPGPRSE
jgi:hypothetical protein